MARNVVAVGLHSSVPGIATRAAWYLIWVRLKEPMETDREVFGDLRAPEGAGFDTAFLFDLLRRTFSEPARDQDAWIASLEAVDACVVDEVRPGSHLVGLLTPAEREAIRSRYNRLHSVKPKEAAQERSLWDSPAPKRPHKDRPFVFRTVSALPRGVVRDSLAVGKCRPSRGEIFGVAAAWYGPDGRPSLVRSYDTPASSACETVALGLAMMTLARDNEFPLTSEPDLLFGVARPDCLSALEEPDVCPSDPCARPIGTSCFLCRATSSLQSWKTGCNRGTPNPRGSRARKVSSRLKRSSVRTAVSARPVFWRAWIPCWTSRPPEP
ncbi:MAG: hypothetical protein WAU32_11340 [Thermoanaerobaculia bacterium]